MSECHDFGGKKHLVEDPLSPATLALIRAVWPNAQPEGSVGHWSWSEDWSFAQGRLPFIVAEAWPHRDRSKGLWLRIRQPEPEKE